MPLVVWRWDAGTMLAFCSHQRQLLRAVELTEIANRLQIRRTDRVRRCAVTAVLGAVMVCPICWFERYLIRSVWGFKASVVPRGDLA
jgi:hypothetical protein